MSVRHSAIAVLFLSTSSALQAATAYRVTIITKDSFKRVPSVRQVLADGENRRLTIESQNEPFTFDVLLSTDSGKTVTALNTSLHTWFDLARLRAAATGLPPWVQVEIKNAKSTVTEEPVAETIAGLPVRKFVIRASYTSREDFGGTKVNREHAMTILLWTTDKLNQSLAFPLPVIATGVASIDTGLQQKRSLISGFPLREVTTISRAYEGGTPQVAITTFDVDDIRTVPSPAASQFTKPAGYVNQEPVIGSPGKS